MKKENFEVHQYSKGLEGLLVYIKKTINSILESEGGISGINIDDPWCPGYFTRNPKPECCDSYDEVYCKHKHPVMGMATGLSIGIIVLFLGAITYRFYKILRYIF
tara:strand:- start:7370 stop:7684 length:315 start_codon:yes stop_codon:yes gene_type:complete